MIISDNVIYLDIYTDGDNQSIDVVFDNNLDFLNVELSEEIFLDVDFNLSSQFIDLFMDNNTPTLDIEMLGAGEYRLPYYEGPYIVNPRKVEQILATEEKSMSSNVTINPIYYAEVSNIAGGHTAYIGME